jgi:hypothetical protein
MPFVYCQAVNIDDVIVHVGPRLASSKCFIEKFEWKLNYLGAASNSN